MKIIIENEHSKIEIEEDIVTATQVVNLVIRALLSIGYQLGSIIDAMHENLEEVNDK